MKFISVSKLDQTTASEKDHGSIQTSEPLTPTELLLAEVWQEVLKSKPVSRHDNFFQLGGDSITATQLLARARSVFNVELPIQKFFGAPELQQMAAEIDRLIQQQPLVKLPLITPVPDGQPVPLSFSQERMWFIHQLDPNSTAYNVTGHLRMTGELNPAILRQSFNELIKRHTSLRTTFPAIGGKPVQRIAPTQEVDFEQIDLRALPVEEREGKALKLLEEESGRPFDIEHGPLMRIILYVLQDQEYILTMSLHHMITDAWSMKVIGQELLALYRAGVRGEEATLPPLEVAYADYAYWQRQWLSGDVLEKHMSYWRKQLSNATPLNLTTDHPRPAVQTYRGSMFSAELPEEFLRGLRQLAQAEDGTIFMVALAAFQTLLYRYTGQSDIAVGVPIANRDWLQSENLIGSLVNTLVFRNDLSGKPTFREFLRRVRKGALEAYAHQSIPFAKLVAELNPTRDTSHSPLTQVMFNVINVPIPEMEFEGLKSEYITTDRGASQFDFTFTIVDVPDYHQLMVEYNLDLFEPETIRRMLDHYLRLLKTVITDPDQPVDFLSLLDEAERNNLLYRQNATQLEYNQELTLPAAFEVQVARTPEQIALIFNEKRLTYRELNERANQLARHIIECGATPGALVGVCMARCPDAIVSFLAAMKAGCAYVPLDPAYPVERLEFMIQDAGMPIILTQNATVQLAAQSASAQKTCLINLEADWPAIARHNAENLELVINSKSAAYVLYTSGSTGRPKGVLGTHRGAINRLGWSWRVHPFEPGEMFCQKTPLNFIDSMWEIYSPLLSGIPSIILPDQIVKDPYALVEKLAHHRVTRITLVPSLLKVILDTHPDLGSRLKHLKACSSGGEALPAALAEKFVQTMPHTMLLNMYGVTEASSESTYYQVTGKSSGPFAPIGKPMDNVQVYVLDTNRQPVPQGVTGELFLGGDGVALGYHNRPELTVERFLPNPFVTTPGEKLYATGDLVRYLPDGNLQYIGRNDFQVKIRGMRVDLGEIEAVLKEHEAVAEVVVVARQDRSNNYQLVAYLVARPDKNVPENDLKQFAARQLPGHMVPGYFIKLNKMPLTPNGKTDKRALPDWETTAKPDSGEIVAPRNESEQKLLTIWQHLLERQNISVTDDFFALGGHSLLAIQLFAEIEKDFGVKLPLSVLFQTPNIEALARLLQSDESIQNILEDNSPLVPIQTGGNKPPFFCVHGIGGAVLNYASLSRYLGNDQPFYSLEAQPSRDVEQKLTTIQAIAADYIKAIKTVQPEGSYNLGGYSYGGTVAFEMAQQLLKQGDEVGLLVMFDNPPPHSGYEKFHLNRRALRGMISNFPYWWKDFTIVPWKERYGRFRRKVFNRKLFTKSGEVNLHYYLVDPSQVPEEFRNLMEKQYRALLDYIPQPYDGHITVLRTPRQPLFCSFDPYLEWGKLAKGGVEAHLIAGSHRNLMEEPNVQVLAKVLRAILDKLSPAKNN